MTRIAGASAVLALVTAAAGCGVGGGGGGGGGGGDDDGSGGYTKPDDKVVCTAHFKVTGTFTPGATPRPTDPDTNTPLDGCWPVGQWDFTATPTSELAEKEVPCSAPPSVLPKYSFKVEAKLASNDGGDDTVQVVTALTTADAMQMHVTVSSTGQGCAGSFELGSADGKDYWNMQPTLSKDPAARTLEGKGDYIEYKADAWPWPADMQ